MSNLISGKTEELKKFVYCCVCNQKSYAGMKQERFYRLENGKLAHMELYMCEKCFLAKEAWPGTKPNGKMTNKEIAGEFDRFKRNRQIYK